MKELADSRILGFLTLGTCANTLGQNDKRGVINRLRLSFAMIAVNRFSYARSGSHTLDVGAISILASAKT